MVDEVPEMTIVTVEGVLELSAVLLLELRSDVVEEGVAIVADRLPPEDADSGISRVVDELPETTTVTLESVIELSTMLLPELARDELERVEALPVALMDTEVVDSETSKVLVEFSKMTTVTTVGGGRRAPDVLLLSVAEEVIESDEAEIVLEVSGVLLLDPIDSMVDGEDTPGVDPGVESVPAMVSSEVEVVLDAIFPSAVPELELVCGRTVFQSIHVKRALDDEGAGRQAGPVLWQGAPYSQQANEVFDEFRLDAVD